MPTIRTKTVLLAACLSSFLAACSGYKPPAPSPLQANPATTPVATRWSAKLAHELQFPLQIASQGEQVLVADGGGLVQALSASTGAAQWSFQAGKPLSAGVGFDGNTAAVVTQDAQLLVFRSSGIVWRTTLQSPTYTAPLVSGGRVFVLGSDQSITAFDGGNGFKLWQHKARLPEGSLVLRQASLLTAANGNLLVGVNGRIVALNPDNGAPLGETLLAQARGSNALSQVIDLMAPASRQGNSLCARVYQYSVGCTSLAGGLNWSQASVGTTGVAGDSQMVVGTDNAGVVTAWARADGKVLWKNTAFQHRDLSAPLLVGSSIVIGDAQGWLHVLSSKDGSLRNRVAVDTSAIHIAPVLVGNTVVVVSNKGVVAGLQVQ